MNYLKSVYNWLVVTDEDAEKSHNSLYLDINTGIFTNFNDTANSIVLQIIYGNKQKNAVNSALTTLDDIRYFKNGNFEFTIHTNSPYFPSWVNLVSDIKIKGNISNYIPEKTYLDTMQIINHIQTVYLPNSKKSSQMSMSNNMSHNMSQQNLLDCDNIDYLYINGILYMETLHYKNMNSETWKCINYLQKAVPLIIGNYYRLEASKISNHM
jgi:hypothetical protein